MNCPRCNHTASHMCRLNKSDRYHCENNLCGIIDFTVEVEDQGSADFLLAD